MDTSKYTTPMLPTTQNILEDLSGSCANQTNEGLNITNLDGQTRKFKQATFAKYSQYEKTTIKSKLKETGVTQYECVTKPQHDAFLAVRERFGVNKCWTCDGFIYIMAPELCFSF
ncbi:unnamed protein product [Euphydryas editha]|uniref:Uncharacterized protein n=1 Tax=Euphydryas editha TaxID=104508 RepID=A0AAU9V1J2_EUPED|nr:unnamed protein product [Euphydryas editha]